MGSLGGNDGAGAGGKVGLPALDVALAFPQATPASLFPPAVSDYYQFDDLLTDEEKALRKKVRGIMEKEIAPVMTEYWEKAEFPFHAIPNLATLGLAGGTIKGYGCPGLSLTASAICIAEVARVDASCSTFILVHSSLAMSTIALCGSEAQKQKYLPSLAQFKTVGCWALTEPDYGSDASSLRTAATKVPGGWHLDGQKRWIGNSTFADVLIILARNADTNQLNGFIVKKGAPGLKATKIENKIGLRMVQNGDIILNKVFVPEEDRLTGINSFQDINKVLAMSRIMVAWQPIGISMGVFDMCHRYLKERKQFGAPLAAFQLNQEKLVRMLGNIQAMLLIGWRLCKLYESGKMTPGHASLGKAWTSRKAREVVSLGRELLGGNGILADFLVAKMGSTCECSLRCQDHHYKNCKGNDEKIRFDDVADEDFNSCMGNKKMRFHVVIDENFRSCMRIPPEVGSHFRKITSETIKINAPNGCLYDIGVSREMGEIVLRSGWDVFSAAHNLEENDSLVFKFFGNSTFKVQIYSSHGGSQKITSCVSPPSEILEAVLPSTCDRHVSNGNEVPYLRHNQETAEFDYLTSGGSCLTKVQDEKVLEMAHTNRSQVPLYVAVMKTTNVDVKSCYISIPSILLKNVTEEVFKATVKLEAPDSNIYSVSAAQQSDDEIALQSGWNDFVVAHRVQVGDLVIFRYKGNSRLEVFILDRNGCQKTSSCFGKEYVSNAQEMCDDSVKIIDPPHSKVDIIDLSSSSSDDDNNVAAYTEKLARLQKQHFDHCAKSRRIDSTSSQSIKLNHDHETHEDLQKYMVDGVSRSRSPLNSNYSEVPSTPLYIISGSITLSAAQGKMVLEKVQSIGSEFPIFVSVMNRTSTSENGFPMSMYFATEYARRCLPLATQDLILQLEGCQSKQWHTVLHVYSVHSRARNYAGIYSGWAKFVTENRLCMGDICMFELVKMTEKLKMIVHLIRK